MKTECILERLSISVNYCNILARFLLNEPILDTSLYEEAAYFQPYRGRIGKGKLNVLPTVNL